jgi:uncharacterized membrane protein YeaQ/YmgE (transglycosylase-associated protein family)
MGLLWWIVFGFVVGVLSKWMVRGNPRLGCLGTILLGVAGSVVGGTIWNVLTGSGLKPETGGLVLSVIGAVLVLVAARKLSER